MNIIKSLLFGSEANYKVYGVDVTFKKGQTEINVFGDSFLGNLVSKCQHSALFGIATLGYLHVFIHEMGHALYKKTEGDGADLAVEIDTNTCQGVAKYSKPAKHSHLASIAGPLLSTFYEITKLVGSIALILLVPHPVSFIIGGTLALGSICWITGEFLYFLSGAGDWENITPNWLKLNPEWDSSILGDL